MQKNWDRFKTYLKNNFVFLIVMALGSIAIFAQMNEVVLYADDYALGMYSSGGINAAIDYNVDHYLHWGGGYTSFIVICLLMFPDIVWKLFLSGLLIIFVGLSVKMICKKQQKYKWMVATLLWSCIFALSILISRESIYWLDGGTAYLFSAFQVFIFFYFIYTRLVQKVTKKYDLILLPLLAFFAGWSSAQSGLAAIIIAIIIIAWQRLIKKEKIKKIYLISLIFSIVGYLIFYFAPGNSVRMDEFAEYASYNLFQKFGYRVNSIFELILSNRSVDFSAAPFFVYLTIGLISLIDLTTINREKITKSNRLRLLCSIYGLTFTIMFLLSTMNIPTISETLKIGFSYDNLLIAKRSGTLSMITIAPYLLASLAVVASLVNAFAICKKQGTPFLLTSLLIGYATEFCMIMAPYSPLRTTLYTIIFMWLAIGYLIPLAITRRVKILPLGALIFSVFNIFFGIIAIILYITTLELKKHNKSLNEFVLDACLFTSIITVIGATNYYQVIINYHQNKIINSENISRLLNYEQFIVSAPPTSYDITEQEDSPKYIYLIPPHNDVYGFTGLAGVDWVEKSVKDYYQIPKNIHLVYEEGAVVNDQ